MKNKLPFLPMSAFDDEPILGAFETPEDQMANRQKEIENHDFGKLLHSQLPIVTVPRPL